MRGTQGAPVSHPLDVVADLVSQLDDALGCTILVEVGAVLGQAAGVGAVNRVDGGFPVGPGTQDGVDVARGAGLGAGGVLAHLGDAGVEVGVAREPGEPAMLHQLVVARLEAGDHFLVEPEAALARDLEVPGFAVRRSRDLAWPCPTASCTDRFRTRCRIRRATWASFIAKIGS